MLSEMSHCPSLLFKWQDLLFRGWIVFHRMYGPHLLCPSSMDRHEVASMSWLLEIMLQWTQGVYIFSNQCLFKVPLDKYPAVELRHHLVVLFLILRNLHTLFHSDFSSWHHHQECTGFPFRYILANIYVFSLEDVHSDGCEEMSLSCRIAAALLSVMSHTFPTPVGCLDFSFGNYSHSLSVFGGLLWGLM